MGLDTVQMWPGDAGGGIGVPWTRVVGGMSIKYPAPHFKIIADSQDITDAISKRLLSLSVTDIAGRKSDTAEIQLDDRDGIVNPRTGTVLEISIGYKSLVAKMGTFIVDEVDIAGPPSTMTIRAKAGDMTGTLKSCQTRIWDNVTIGEIVTTIAASHGYTAKVSDALASEIPGYLVQFYESDLNFLTRLSREISGVMFKPKNGVLLFMYRGEAKSVSGKDLVIIGLEPTDVTKWRATNAGRNSYSKVVARYRDLDANQYLKAEAGAGEPTWCIARTYKDLTSAQKAADGKLKTLSRKTQTLSISMPGNPDIIAEARLSLAGFRTGVDGEWTVKNAVHKISKSSGYTTSIAAEIKI